MRQGIVVTALLAVFVGIAIFFTGGRSLFAMPAPSPVASLSPAPILHVAQPAIAANRTVVGAADTLAFLRWLSVGFAELDFGRQRSTGQGFAGLLGRAVATAAAPITPPAGRPSVSDAEAGGTLVEVVEPHGVAALSPRKVSYEASSSDDSASPRADVVAARPHRDLAADRRADLERFTAAARAGDLDAKYRLGLLYRDAKGADRDPAAAAHWLLAAAKAGHPLAELAIGEMYAGGIGVTRDPAAAYLWLDLAAHRCTEAIDRSFARSERDRVATALSQSELGTARGLASAWKPSTDAPGPG